MYFGGALNKNTLESSLINRGMEKWFFSNGQLEFLVREVNFRVFKNNIKLFLCNISFSEYVQSF